MVKKLKVVDEREGRDLTGRGEEGNVRHVIRKQEEGLFRRKETSQKQAEVKREQCGEEQLRAKYNDTYVHNDWPVSSASYS